MTVNKQFLYSSVAFARKTCVVSETTTIEQCEGSFTVALVGGPAMPKGGWAKTGPSLLCPDCSGAPVDAVAGARPGAAGGAAAECLRGPVSPDEPPCGPWLTLAFPTHGPHSGSGTRECWAPPLYARLRPSRSIQDKIPNNVLTGGISKVHKEALWQHDCVTVSSAFWA